MRIYRSVLLLGLICTLRAQTVEDALRPFWMANFAGSSANGLSSELVAAPHIRLGFSHNPAALGIVTRPQFLFSFQSEQFRQMAQIQRSTDDQVNAPCVSANLAKQTRVTRFDGFRLVYPIPVYRGSWVLGIAYTPAYTYLNNFKIKGRVPTSAGPYQLEQESSEDGVLYTLRIATAVEFQRNLMLGISLNRYTGFRDYLSTALDQDIEDNFTYTKFIRDEVLKPTYKGWNLETGLFWNHSPILFGARLSSPVKLQVKENYRLTDIEQQDDGTTDYYADTSIIHYNLRAPWEWALGLSYEGKRYTLSTEFGQCDWRNLEFSSNLYTTDSSRLDPIINTDIAQRLQSAWQLGLGLNLNLTKRLDMYFGYRLIQRPYRDLPSDQQNYHLLSCGLEAALDPQIVLGLGYQVTHVHLSPYNSYFQVESDQEIWHKRLTFSLAILL